MLVRFQADNLSAAIGHLGRTWKNLNPDYPFDYRFLNDDLGSIYRSEEKMGNILGYFSLLAVSIAGLGLFGLSSYVAEQRTKEIGIRKALGASEFDIIYLLSKEYSQWILLANIIAWPVGWYVMHQWLDHFAHRTGINLWLFIVVGGFSFIIAGLSISFQSIKAAVADPVASLRYE
jgi:putative ABC transport system permease protein